MRLKNGSNDIWDGYVTGNSKNIGTLPVGDYRFIMRAYNAAGKGGLDSTWAYFSVAPKTTTDGSVATTITVRTYEPKSSDSFYSFYTKPTNPFQYKQCTWYAFGRASEYRGKALEPTIRGNARDWYDNAKDKYSRNKNAPKVGSIAVWTGVPIGQPGHVAIVESVNQKGEIQFSQGNYNGNAFNLTDYTTVNSTKYFPQKAKYNADGSMAYQGLQFKGYIYTNESTVTSVATTTSVNPTASGVLFPVSGSQTNWIGYVYGGDDSGKGEHYGTDYRAIDMNLPDNADKNLQVVAIANGRIVKIIPNYGEMHIKHTVPLTLKDGSKTYNTWYSVYVHMKIDTKLKVNDNVKKGDGIGNISNKSPDKINDHLHFLVTTKLTANSSVDHKDDKYNQYTISPLWLSDEYAKKITVKPISNDKYDKEAASRITESTASASANN